MGQIIVPRHVTFIGGGGAITYSGSVSRCIWWELVGVDTGVEGAPYGSLSNEEPLTDADGLATAHYTAPTTALTATQSDRIKVHESV